MFRWAFNATACSSRLKSSQLDCIIKTSSNRFFTTTTLSNPTTRLHHPYNISITYRQTHAARFSTKAPSSGSENASSKTAPITNTNINNNTSNSTAHPKPGQLPHSQPTVHKPSSPEDQLKADQIALERAMVGVERVGLAVTTLGHIATLASSPTFYLFSSLICSSLFYVSFSDRFKAWREAKKEKWMQFKERNQDKWWVGKLDQASVLREESKVKLAAKKDDFEHFLAEKEDKHSELINKAKSTRDELKSKWSLDRVQHQSQRDNNGDTVGVDVERGEKMVVSVNNATEGWESSDDKNVTPPLINNAPSSLSQSPSPPNLPFSSPLYGSISDDVVNESLQLGEEGEKQGRMGSLKDRVKNKVNSTVAAAQANRF